MKKGIVRQNWIHYRKWIVTWAVLIFILSLISLSAARAGYGANSPENAGMNQGSKILTDKGTYDRRSTGESLDSNDE